MKNKVLKITAALLFLLPHAGLDNNRFPVMLFLFYICSFVFFATTWSGMKEDWSRNSRTCFIVSGIVLSLFYGMSQEIYMEPIVYIRWRYYGYCSSLFMPHSPCPGKQTLPCLGSHSDCRSGNRFGNRPVHRSTGE